MTNSSVSLSGGASVLSAHAEAPSSQASMILASKKLMKHAAAPLLKQMGMSRARTDPVQFLDSACGTGVVTQEVQGMLARDVLDKSTFICADSSRVLVDVVAGRIQDEAWVNTQAEVLDARVRVCPVDRWMDMRETAELMFWAGYGLGGEFAEPCCCCAGAALDPRAG